MINWLPDPAKQLVAWVASQAVLRARGAEAGLIVDAVSKQPELSFGKNVSIGTGSVLGGGEILLSDRVSIGNNSVLRGKIDLGTGTNLVARNRLVGDVTIGNYCALASGSSVQQRDHDMQRTSIQAKMYSHFDFQRLESTDRHPVSIGHDVWLGLGATVISGVTIGNGAVVGAGAVVSRDVEPYEIVAGNPAEHVGWRFEAETREVLQDIAWWNWSDNRIRRNNEFFAADLAVRPPESIRELVVQ